jgi:hypothetical protein
VQLVVSSATGDIFNQKMNIHLFKHSTNPAHIVTQNDTCLGVASGVQGLVLGCVLQTFTTLSYTPRATVRLCQSRVSWEILEGTCAGPLPCCGMTDTIFN